MWEQQHRAAATHRRGHVPSPTCYKRVQVLKNPSVPFQEGTNVTLESLTSRGIKPYGPAVDVWAAGVLAYELVRCPPGLPWQGRGEGGLSTRVQGVCSSCKAHAGCMHCW